ncbi:hypothetical protein Mapa_009872 [Marchantia paleacea]|nr:hypothetical protein Mapa_009872 [Marchantia paleacea]
MYFGKKFEYRPNKGLNFKSIIRERNTKGGASYALQHLVLYIKNLQDNHMNVTNMCIVRHT